ncbi:hypothetical protein Leryth_021310 [Lithospermum erythrorhizon]|nr:hypothetical protein Leryth_021310 [Lithospermum erythrorhizon]
MFQEFGKPNNRRMMNINGPRPNSLSINQTSHSIKKNPKPISFQKQPIIIYTHSPKIIHADAKDFMALVQNLTGVLRRSEDKIVHEKSKGVIVANVEKNKKVDEINNKNNSSWIMTEDNVNNDEPKYNFADFPLFTPNSSNLFCSPQSSLRSNNYDNAISSFLEVMNGLQEY